MTDETLLPKMEGILGRLVHTCGATQLTATSRSLRRTEHRQRKAFDFKPPDVNSSSGYYTPGGVGRKCRPMVTRNPVGELEARLQQVIENHQPGMWRDYIADLVAVKTRIEWHEEFEHLHRLIAL